MSPEAPISRSIVIESVPSAASKLCKQILAELEANGFSDEDLFAVHLGLQEAFINALRHGNNMDPRKQIKVEYTVDRHKVEVFLEDEGGGFDADKVPDPRCGENLYKAEGRGLFLMRSYMDIVEYNERGNCVHMVRYKEKPPLTDASR